jgi:hypothetical protein
MSESQRHEIRVAPWRMALVVLSMAGFVVMGGWGVIEGPLPVKLAGLLSIVFFGGFGAWAMHRKSRGYGRVAVTRDGIEMTMFDARMRLIPWSDIEAIGVAEVSRQQFTTIRLKRYGSLIDGLSDAEIRSALRHFNAMRMMSQATIVAAAVNLEQSEDLDRFVSGSGGLRSLAEVLHHMRTVYGAELLLAWNQRDRKAAAFAQYLEERRLSRPKAAPTIVSARGSG